MIYYFLLLFYYFIFFPSSSYLIYALTLLYTLIRPQMSTTVDHISSPPCNSLTPRRKASSFWSLWKSTLDSLLLVKRLCNNANRKKRLIQQPFRIQTLKLWLLRNSLLNHHHQLVIQEEQQEEEEEDEDDDEEEAEEEEKAEVGTASTARRASSAGANGPLRTRQSLPVKQFLR